MGEFVRQPHPDAAHRERLSREIPGLSPRQVQVWFQNRRAKMKRMAVDDRDRVIKMRALPDDFDNVQALHMPYGAVHSMGTPMASPVDFGGVGVPSPYGDHMMRPLMVDVRRADGGDDGHHGHLSSPTGLSPAFGSIGFNASAAAAAAAAAAALNSPDILSPLSPTSASDAHHHHHHHHGVSAHQAASHHRYGSYSSHLSPVTPTTSSGTAASATTPTTSRPGSSNPYRQTSFDGLTTTSTATGSGLTTTAGSSNGGSSLHQQRQLHNMRPLQPLHLRETMSRSRSDNLQSPLRSSMSWKGDSLDYSNYHNSNNNNNNNGSSSPQLAGRPQTSLYGDSMYDSYSSRSSPPPPPPSPPHPPPTPQQPPPPPPTTPQKSACEREVGAGGARAQ